MGGRLLLSLYSSSHASRIRRITGNLPISAAMRRYNQGNEESHSVHGVEERAPSTAEEFERVAEEKARQGLASQTVEKTTDAAGEAAAPGGDSTFESVKEAYKEPHSGGGHDFHKTGTGDGQEAVTGGSQISS